MPPGEASFWTRALHYLCKARPIEKFHAKDVVIGWSQQFDYIALLRRAHLWTSIDTNKRQMRAARLHDSKLIRRGPSQTTSMVSTMVPARDISNHIWIWGPNTTFTPSAARLMRACGCLVYQCYQKMKNIINNWFSSNYFKKSIIFMYVRFAQQRYHAVTKNYINELNKTNMLCWFMHRCWLEVCWTYRLWAN